MNLALWTECLADIFQEHGVVATVEQIEAVAKDAKFAAENDISEYVPENPLIRENKELERKLKIEREKVVCPRCKGRGMTESFGPCFVATSQCSECRGEGKVLP